MRDTAPEQIFLAARIHTLDESATTVDALGVTGGRITHRGSRVEASQWTGPQTVIHDFGPATIVPGLVDAHTHPIFGIGMTTGLSLTGIGTLAEAEQLLAEYATDRASDEWVLAWGVEQTIFGDDVPSFDFLERAAPGRKVFALLFDGHAGVASRAALEFAGVVAGEKLSDGSEICVGADGLPNGFLRELGAMERIRELLPALSFEDKVDALRAVLTDMAAHGITGIEVLDNEDPQSIDLLRAIEDQGELPVRVRLAPWFMAKHAPEKLDEVVDLQGIAGRRFEVRGAKLMIDGTVDNGTAWLHEPDTEGEGGTSLWLRPGDYADALERLHTAGVTTTTHAIGDQGISFVAQSIGALPPGGPRHRIEHIEALSDADLQELRASGATASMQPTHCTHFIRPDRTDAWSRRLGPERARTHTFRLRDVHDAGVVLALGSDWPIAPYDPREIIADAQTRRRTAQLGSGVIDEQRLSAREALEGYTRNVYRSTGLDGGTLEIGMVADLTVFGADPLGVSPEDFLTADVLATFISGERVMTRNEA